MAALEWLRRLVPSLLMGLYLLALWLHGSTQFDHGHQQAQDQLRKERAEQRAEVAEHHLQRLHQEVERANRAEAALLDAQARHATEQRQLQERIAHVTTHYRPAPAAAPVAVPRCVFTAGWLRDFNLALGATLPTAAAGAAATGAAQATWPAAGPDAELLESGVTPADILAFAQDYGRWARDNLEQLNRLLDLQEKD